MELNWLQWSKPGNSAVKINRVSNGFPFVKASIHPAQKIVKIEDLTLLSLETPVCQVSPWLASEMEKAMAPHSRTLAWRTPGMGAWWAAIHGVAQGWTQLKWLSSSIWKLGFGEGSLPPPIYNSGSLCLTCLYNVVYAKNLLSFWESEILVCSGQKSEIAQSCLTLCDPIDCSLLGSSVHGIFQAIVLEWVAISFSRESSQPRAQTWVPRIVGRRFTVWATRRWCLCK